jgi:hypothetical protein
MKRILLAVALAGALGAAHAVPFEKGNPAAGQKLFEEAKCNGCHAKMMGGDGNRLFTRPDRKVTDAKSLASRIRACATQLNVQWFPEDEEHVAAWLNSRFYKFK